MQHPWSSAFGAGGCIGVIALMTSWWLATAAPGRAPLPTRGFPFETLALLGVLIVLVVLLAVVVMVLRARFIAQSARSSARSVGLMDELRQMRDEGRISEAEFQAVRSKMNSRLRDEIKSSQPTPEPRGSKSAKGRPQ